MSSLGILINGARVLLDTPAMLRKPIGADEARTVLRERLGRRESDFLALVRTTVFERPGSPCHALLRHAGCEQGDLGRLVHLEGVEESC